ncbi:hypothetical protein J3B02_002078 [Coemansia erecta]|nr:hypothetical protein J3B02_002078 [Coemansia erecta]KAJ2888885.1 hypothetical protein FB639_000315 [Coemansia asiatica]
MSIQQYDSHYREELAATRKQQKVVRSKSHIKPPVDVDSLKLRLEDAKMNYRKRPETDEFDYKSPNTSMPGTPDSGLRRSERRRSQRVLVNDSVVDQPLSAPPAMGRLSSLRSSSSSSYRASSSKSSSASTSTSTSSSSASVSVSVSGSKRRISSFASETTSDSRLSSSTKSKSRKRKTSSSSRNSSSDQSSSHRSQAQEAPALEDSSAQCFICHKVLDGDMDAINKHIDDCLIQPLEDSSVSSGTASEKGAAEVDEGPVIEYEWSGQTRIRATAMLEGGPAAAGLGFSSSGQMDRDEDVDVDAEDETSFGAAQYTDADLVFTSGSGSQKNYIGAAPQWEETPLPLDDPKIAAAAHAADAARGVTGGSTSAMQLVVDALKARIQEQDRMLKTVKRCTICLESYDQPCVSS